MHNKITLTVIFVFAFICIGESVSAQNPSTEVDLLKKVPAGANLLVSINAASIQEKASAGTTEQVKAMFRTANAWPVTSAWGAQKVVMASELDIEHMAPIWQMATVAFEKQPEMDKIGKQQNAVIDQLSNRDLLWLHDACLMKTGPYELTLVSPLNRQSAARWLGQLDARKSPALSPFLDEFSRTMFSSDIGIAIDLQNVFRPAEIEAAIANSTLLSKVDPSPSQLLSSIRGIEIDCRLSGSQNSSISIVFGESTDSLKAVAKTLIFSALVKSGAMLDEFDQWDIQTAGKKITMTGKLTPAGLKRLLSLSHIGTVAARTSAPAESNTESNEAAENPELSGINQDKTRMRRASKTYFNSIADNIENLTRYAGSNTNKSMERNSLWINNYANSIERQSTRNVDPLMINYGQYVSSSMQQMVEQYHASSENKKIRDLRATPFMGETRIGVGPVRTRSYGGRYRNNYRYAPMASQSLNIGAAIRDREAIRLEETSKADNFSNATMKEIEKATATIKSAMAKKYGEF